MKWLMHNRARIGNLHSNIIDDKPDEHEWHGTTWMICYFCFLSSHFFLSFFLLSVLFHFLQEQIFCIFFSLNVFTWKLDTLPCILSLFAYYMLVYSVQTTCGTFSIFSGNTSSSSRFRFWLTQKLNVWKKRNMRSTKQRTHFTFLVTHWWIWTIAIQFSLEKGDSTNRGIYNIHYTRTLLYISTAHGSN